MYLEFTKMHGLGNDFMVVDLITQRAYLDTLTIQRLADRHFGVGFDQLLIVEPPDFPDVDFKYRIFNADGSEVEQCGNGVRCFARFVHERQLTTKTKIRVQTKAGIVEPELGANGLVRVNMGPPKFLPDEIPFVTQAHEDTEGLYALELADNQSINIDVVNMGNPHAVTIVPDVLTADVANIGPQVESHVRFPARVNAGFMQIIDEKHLKMAEWERGTGITLACGSAACASVVAGVLREKTVRKCTVELPGGSLQVEWLNGKDNSGDVLMRGPVAYVFSGEIEI